MTLKGETEIFGYDEGTNLAEMELSKYPEWFVIGAWYGPQDEKAGEMVDVKDKVLQLQRTHETVQASNKLFGDPAPHYAKELDLEVYKARLGSRVKITGGQDVAKLQGKQGEVTRYLDGPAHKVEVRLADSRELVLVDVADVEVQDTPLIEIIAPWVLSYGTLFGLQAFRARTLRESNGGAATPPVLE